MAALLKLRPCTMRRETRIPISVLLFGFALILSAAPSFAQDGSMKACGEKWQAAKAANATQGATWPKFLADCRANLAAVAAVPAAPTPKSQPATGPAASVPSAPPSVAGSQPVFPAAVNSKFAELRPSQARQKTCSEQYQANKTKNANGGLRWLEKGGGYWSLCNKRLKGA
jgi:hypothetical protein